MHQLSVSTHLHYFLIDLFTFYYKRLCNCFKCIVEGNHFYQRQMSNTKVEVLIKQLKVL